MENEALSDLLIAIVGILLGSYVTWFINRNREKVLLAFDMHKEMNNVEMAKHRRIAAKLIEEHPTKNFRELFKEEEEKSISVLMIMRFYQRLWLSIKHRQIKASLVNELFSEIFYYWYYLSYRNNLVGLDWDAAIQIKDLATWFERNDYAKKYLESEKWATGQLEEREKALLKGKTISG